MSANNRSDQRWAGAAPRTLVAMCALAVVVGYTDRVNISVASIAMRDQFHWSQTTMGFVLSSFFIGYMSLMAVAGLLATKFGGIRVLGIAVLAWSLCTLATPLAAMTSLTALIAVRIAMGLGEAAMIPACYELIGRYVPAPERTRAVTRFLTGIPVGMVAGLAASGWLVSHLGWPSTFYGFGILGLVWCLGWWWRAGAANSAASQPATKVSSGLSSPQQLTLRLLLSRRASWALFCGHFSANWLLFFLLSWLPSYFRDGLGLNITNAGLFSAGPWVAMGVATNVAGPVADALARRGVRLVVIRKLMQTVGLGVPAICLFLLRDVNSAQTALILVCLSAAALGCSWAGYAANAIDLAPRYSGVVMGVSNTFATIPGIVGVAMSGWLVDMTGTFSAAFFVAAAVSVVGAVIFLLFASADPIVS